MYCFQPDKSFVFDAEFLYWKVYEGNSLDFAFYKDFPVYKSAAAGPADGLTGQDYDGNTFEWKPGFRLQFNYQTSHDS
jgi:hypothetical protein